MERSPPLLLRPSGIFLWATLALINSFAGSSKLSAAPAPYQTTTMFGVEYLDVRDFGRRFGLSATWTEREKSMRLKSATTTFELSVNSVESSLNGVLLFLGEPVVLRDGKLFIGRRDAEEFLGPILTLNAGASRSAVKTIVIDAGHGGNDPGNQNPRLKLNEKTFTLDVARRLEKLLKAQGFKVIMTRQRDRAVELDDRAAIANKARADLFISIHFNAFSRPAIEGTETYVMTPLNQRSSPQAERDRSMVSTRYPANTYDRWNAVLGFQMHRAIIANLKSTDRGLKRFRYSVLRSVECPAVLVEAGFLSNDPEGKKISSTAYRQRIADSIAAGVSQHVSLRQRALPRRG